LVIIESANRQIRSLARASARRASTTGDAKTLQGWSPGGGRLSQKSAKLLLLRPGGDFSMEMVRCPRLSSKPMPI
jgi:hypothetical protein